MQHFSRFLLVAFLCWLVPFAVSLPFFSQTGALLINFWLFKSIMVVLLIVTALLSMRWFYRQAGVSAAGAGQWLLMGFGVLLINVALDALTILQWNPMSWAAYGRQIAWAYLLLIPLSLLSGARHQAKRLERG